MTVIMYLVAICQMTTKRLCLKQLSCKILSYNLYPDIEKHKLHF